VILIAFVGLVKSGRSAVILIAFVGLVKSVGVIEMTRSNRPFNFHNLLSSAHICITDLSSKECDEIIRIVNRQKSRIIASRMEQVTREITVLQKEVARRELNE
tara:strand:+ start:43 stop:351 length:309 start_codon:yes stop_codon:yes gene_type:complete